MIEFTPAALPRAVRLPRPRSPGASCLSSSASSSGRGPGFGQTAGGTAVEALPRVFVKSSLALPDLAGRSPFVRFVADDAAAQVLVSITSQPSGQGEEFTIVFTGREEFAGLRTTS